MNAPARHLRPIRTPESPSPHIDLDAERAVLGAVLLTRPTERAERCSNTTLTKVAALVQPRDFSSPDLREVFEAFLTLDAQGLPIDLRTTCAELRARNRLNTVGGAQSIADLSDAVPTVVHAVHHARIVAELGALRRVQAAVEALTHDLVTAEGGPVATLARARTQLGAMLEVRRKSGVTAAEHAEAARVALLAAVEARAQGRFGAARFGLECLDGAADGTHGGLLGGILPARVVTVSAPPGAGKTTLVTQAAIVTACDGGRVLWFSTEIPGREVALRYACQSAVPPVNQVDALAGCLDDAELARVGEGLRRFGKLPVNIYSDDLSIEAIAATVASECAQSARDGIPVRLVVLDYFQDLEESERESEVAEAKHRARKVKDLSREQGVGVLVVSSMKKSAQEKAAAGARATTANLYGGGIDYASDVVIELRRTDPDDRATVVDVVLEITKARYGAMGSPGVRFDMPSGRFYEAGASTFDGSDGL